MTVTPEEAVRYDPSFAAIHSKRGIECQTRQLIGASATKQITYLAFVASWQGRTRQKRNLCCRHANPGFSFHEQGWRGRQRACLRSQNNPNTDSANYPAYERTPVVCSEAAKTTNSKPFEAYPESLKEGRCGS